MNRVNQKKKKKKRLNLRPLKILVVLVLIGVASYFAYKYRVDLMVSDAIETIASYTTNKKVNVPEQSYSSKNSIEGQILIDNQDGYTATFTTLNKTNQKTYKEYKQNIDSSWSEKEYWGGTMRENGCGITTLAIIASGYNIDITPDDLREEYYPHLDAEKMTDALEEMGIKSTDFYFHKSYLNKKYIFDWLKTNRPVIVCVGNDEPNKWTTSSHYMALLDINEKGMVYLSNPNGEDDEETQSRLV